MKTLREQMLVDLQLSGAKPNTQRSYLREVDNLAKYFNRSPEELGEAELKAVPALPYKGKASVRGDIPVLCCGPQIFIPNDAEAGMDGGEDPASQGQEETSYRSGSLGGGIPLCGDDESQTQGDPDDHVLIGIEGQ